ncbi:alpha/beta fold hydrolase [Actinoplanes sp. CA-054009]
MLRTHHRYTIDLGRSNLGQDRSGSWPILHLEPDPRVDALDLGRPVLAAAVPGLCDGRSPLRTVKELAAHYLELLHGTEASLVGWSLGGVIAMEMAELSQYLIAAAGIDTTPVTAAQCPDDQTLRRWALGVGVIGPHVDFAALSSVFRGNVEALATAGMPSYGGPVLYLAAGDDAAERRWEPWQAATGANIEVRKVGGGHFSMMTRPQAGRPTAKEIARWLHRPSST